MSKFDPRDPKWIKESHEFLEPRGIIPNVVETTPRGTVGWDLFSRLLKERIIFIGTPIDDMVANSIVGQLLYLQSEDATKDINMYINSPGGSIYAGLAIYDTIQWLRPDVSTVCMGMAMSMGAVLLAAGAKEKRFALPNSTMLIHSLLVVLKVRLPISKSLPAKSCACVVACMRSLHIIPARPPSAFCRTLTVITT
jgi:ATP-dependent Clp protease protease subunit